MRDDVIGETLRLLELRGTVYFKADFQAPWGMAVPARDVAAFHVVVSGQCWLRLGGGVAHSLSAGDIVLFPTGQAHALADTVETKAKPAEEVLRGLSEAGASSMALLDRAEAPREETTTLVCGHFSYDSRAFYPFFCGLPDVVRVSATENEHSSWLAAAAQLAAAESESSQRGATAVVDRLAEALLLQTLRVFLAHTADPRGFVVAAADPAIGTALATIHSSLDRHWTVAELAHEAGLSRSSFSARFRDLVGESPRAYWTRIRMLVARRLLREAQLSTAQIAHRVGYGSEFAFARACKRFFGQGPGALRRAS